MNNTSYESLLDGRSINISPVEHTFADGTVIYGFPSSSVDLFSIVLLYEAGAFYQDMPLQADAALQLFDKGTLLHSPQQVAEFIDYRGIIVNNKKKRYVGEVTSFMLRRYAMEFLPLLHEMLTQPLFVAQEFSLYKARMRQSIMLQEERTAMQAQQMREQALYGATHPFARFATLDDVERLSLDAVKSFFAKYYTCQRPTVILSGSYGEEEVAMCHDLFGGSPVVSELTRCMVAPMPREGRLFHKSMASSQTSIDIARLLPLDVEGDDYLRFVVLNTLLGGYFGSRLMRNIREEKGFTYGINSSVSVLRGDVSFDITLDCGNAVVREALDEIYVEIARLANERVPEEELDVVRRYIEGSFLRSIDGVFELSNRFMTSVEEGLNIGMERLMEIVSSVTPDDIQRLAQRMLSKEELYEICVGEGVK